MTSDLEKVIAFFDAVQEMAKNATRPVYAETCPCGGSIEIGREAPPSERRRLANNFLGRHLNCTTEAGDPS